MSKIQKDTEARERLLRWLPRGSKVWWDCVKFTRAGNRYVRLLAVVDNEIYDITAQVCRALGWNWNDRNGGVDMGGDDGSGAVGHLSFNLYAEEYQLKAVRL